MAEPGDVTGAILSGGRGSRAGGIDKGLLEIDAEPAVVRVARSLLSQVARIVVSANRNLERYAAPAAQLRRVLARASDERRPAVGVPHPRRAVIAGGDHAAAVSERSRSNGQDATVMVVASASRAADRLTPAGMACRAGASSVLRFLRIRAMLVSL